MFDGKKLRVCIDGRIFTITESCEQLFIHCKGGVSAEEGKRVQEILGVDEDLEKFYSLCEDDTLLWSVPRLLHGLHVRKHSLWEAILIGVCQQNASFVQGWRMAKKLWLLFGEEREGFIMPPSPHSLYKSRERLREAGVGYRAKTFLSLSAAALDGHLSLVESVNAVEAMKLLCKIPGVGEYTAAWSLLFSRREYTLFLIDRWFKKVLAAAYPEGVEDAKRKWSEWWGLFCFFTTVVTEASVAGKVLEKMKRGKLLPSLKPLGPTPLSLYNFI
jgi:3-methyladenine DNA glycosylase/8-oxoguanine DNA glycosylase